MKRFYVLLFTAFLLLSHAGLAQVIVTSPIFPTDNDSCTVIFDAALGNGGLNNVSPPIYAHTGVITNLSTTSSDWKYVVAGWAENLPKALMTPLGNNKYQLKVKPAVRSYYGVPVSEQIEKMAFVFRNADGSKTGKNADGSDIFVDMYSNTFNVNIVLPAVKSLFLKLNDPIPVSAISPTATSMKILVNGVEVKTNAGQFITDTLTANNFGTNWAKQWVKIVALNNTGSAADSFSYTVIPPARIALLPSGIDDGINYIDSATVILCLCAPKKDNAFVVGDFNNWQTDSAYYMNLTPDSTRFWVQIKNLVPKQEYIFQYLVDGNLRIGDPYADKVSDPDDKYITAKTYPNLMPYPAGKANGIATYLQTGQDSYPWNMTPFTPPAVTDLVVYELLIRDFTADHDYPSLIDTLDYLKHLGINAIELMPVMEFEGNESWGYNPNFSFAVDKYYGTKNGLKQFVEAAHLRGIAVILDIVCNHHFGSSPLARLFWDGPAQRPAANNPWFNPIPKHPYNVGNDFNHESAYTNYYMKRLIRYWLTEYHVDGYRFDLSKGFTQKDSYPDNVSLWGQKDPARINILTSYTMLIHSVNPNAYAIMEHFADNSEETVLSSNNMLLWGNMNGKYNEATMGWNTGANSNFSWISYKERGWSQPHAVGFMESHDEERLPFKNIKYGNASANYNVKDTGTSLKRMELAATFFFTIPGPKMIWQFGELGYDYSIDSGGGRLAPKPVRWDYQNDWRRRYTKNIFAALIALKKNQPAFSTTTYTLDVAGAVKRIWLRHSTMDVTVLGNFDVNAVNVVPGFTRRGMWYEFFTGDSLNVADTAAALVFNAGEYRLYTTTRLQKPYFTSLDEHLAPGTTTLGNVTVYPNPSGGLFNFEVNLSQPSSGIVTVYNVYGETVLRPAPVRFKQGINNFTVDITQGKEKKMTPGFYIYTLEAGGVVLSGKLLVE
ncbi:MAG: alpha-amylase family glycosyl hydrolase [Bacteroidetes bacterium]|nr:alpha-amylase family glycosyl hydrolase [Bacteroidota bacterium]